MAPSRADRTSRPAEQHDPFGFKAIRDELSDIFAPFRNFPQCVETLQRRLEAAAVTAEEEVGRWTRRIEELENENEQQRVRIEQLERRLARARAQRTTDGPSTDLQQKIRALHAERDELQSKLKHAIKYNHDLSGRVVNNTSMASTSPRSRYTTAQSSSPRTPNRQGSALGSSRAHRDPPLSPMDFNGREDPRGYASRAARVETVASDDDGGEPPNNDNASERTVEGPRDIYANYSFDAGPPPPGEEPDLTFQFKISDIPNAARVRCGPKSLRQLQELLGLKPDIVQELGTE